MILQASKHKKRKYAFELQEIVRPIKKKPGDCFCTKNKTGSSLFDASMTKNKIKK